MAAPVEVCVLSDEYYNPPPRYFVRQNPRYLYEDEPEWSSMNWCEFVVVIALTAVLLIGALALTIFWAEAYRDGFAWDENNKQQFNFHPVLMVAGFITCSGYSIMFFRICRCFRRIHVKVFHTIFHAIAIPLIVFGFIAVFRNHNNSAPPITNFNSVHSWLGCLTMALFVFQFVFGLFSFLILLCYEDSSANFRVSLVPIHAAVGLGTFMLAIATCLTGLTYLGSNTAKKTEESQVLNVLALVFAVLGILIIYICMRETFRFNFRHDLYPRTEYMNYSRVVCR